MVLDCASIQVLAMTLQDLSVALVISAVSLNLLQFWQSKPEAESVFATRGILKQRTHFHPIIQALDNFTADRVQVIILNPSADPSDSIKEFGKSQEAKDQVLLSFNGLRDQKLSNLLKAWRI